MHVIETWKIDIPSLLGLPDASFDDAGIDSNGYIYACDGTNGKIYKVQPDGTGADVCLIPNSSTSSFKLAVMPDSTFYTADISSGMVMRYDENGSPAGSFGAPGILSLCAAPDGVLYTLSKNGCEEQLNAYDELGSLINSIPIYLENAHNDPILINLDADSNGSLYLNLGTPPYHIWKINPETVEIASISRPIEYPDDAILISDIAIDQSTNMLWVLLAYRELGRQMIDLYNPDGSLSDTLAIPRSDNLYGLVCAHNGSVYLLDTGSGPGSANILCLQIKE
ncbi:MAG: NHL repeat-containing protein [Armatimonadota bacterium]